MAVAIIADAHLGGPGGPAEPLVEQLAQLAAAGCERLVLLGDLFQVWVGAPQFETSEIRKTLTALEQLRVAGIPLDYVEGNRDFFIGESDYAGIFDRIGSEVAFEAGGRQYLAVHGDGLNKRDVRYLIWHWLSKSSISRFGMFHLPPSLARKLIGVTEKQLSRTNFKHKSKIPADVIRRYAGRRLKEGYDVVLLGHYHQPCKWTIEEGEVELLDAWFRSKKVQWFGRQD